MDFVQNERLGWTDFEAKGKAFEEDGEFVEGLLFFVLAVFSLWLYQVRCYSFGCFDLLIFLSYFFQ